MVVEVFLPVSVKRKSVDPVNELFIHISWGRCC